MISSLIAALYRTLQVLLTVLMAILIVPVVLQILSRFTELIPRYIWTEEIARFCFIWIRHGAMLLVALTFVWFGYEFALFGFEQESELSGLNMLAIHIAWPLAGVVYVLFLGEKIVQDIRIWRGRSGE